MHVLETCHALHSCEPLGNNGVGSSQKLCLREKSLLLLQASGKEEGHWGLHDGRELLGCFTTALTGWNNPQVIGLYTQGIFRSPHPPASKPSAAEWVVTSSCQFVPYCDGDSSSFTSSPYLSVFCCSHKCSVFLIPAQQGASSNCSASLVWTPSDSLLFGVQENTGSKR